MNYAGSRLLKNVSSLVLGCSLHLLARVQTTVGLRSFAFYGPIVWKCMPSALRDSIQYLSLTEVEHVRVALKLSFWTVI